MDDNDNVVFLLLPSVLIALLLVVLYKLVAQEIPEDYGFISISAIMDITAIVAAIYAAIAAWSANRCVRNSRSSRKADSLLSNHDKHIS